MKVKLSLTYNKEFYEISDFVYLHSIHFFRSEKGNPVSFGLAKALEAGRQAHFYVNPKASLGDLLSDWIAPHELSHLSIPFLEKKDKWFTEGFATFLSRQLLLTAILASILYFVLRFILRRKSNQKSNSEILFSIVL